MEEKWRPKLVILGASHAKRLYLACLRNEKIQEKFELCDHTQPGATIRTLRLQDNFIKELTSRDSMIIQFFGNDMLKRHTHVTRNPKVIHLTKFEPQDKEYMIKVYHEFKEKIHNCHARIIFIDAPYRHLPCCTAHIHNGLVKYLAKRNMEMKEMLSPYPVLDHRKLSVHDFRNFRSIENYRKCLIDAVHLQPKCYDRWAMEIFKLLQAPKLV